MQVKDLSIIIQDSATLLQHQVDCTQRPALEHVVVNLCGECLSSLSGTSASSPPKSLVRVDRGPQPPDLEPLVHLEVLFVAQGRLPNQLVIIKPKEEQRPKPDSHRHKGLKCHRVAFGAPGPAAVLRAVPLAVEEVAEILQVVVTGPVLDAEHARNIAKKAKVLELRGPLIVRHCLKHVTIAKKLGLDLPFSRGGADGVLGVQGVPEAFLRTVRNDPSDLGRMYEAQIDSSRLVDSPENGQTLSCSIVVDLADCADGSTSSEALKVAAQKVLVIQK